MISTRPTAAPPPLEYRYALDAAMSALAGTHPPLVLCQMPALDGEIDQRLPWRDWPERARAALWVEPLRQSWRAELRSLAGVLPGGAPLVVVVSRPLARLLPARPLPSDVPLGLACGGIGKLRRALRQSGFGLEGEFGLHTPIAVGLHQIGDQLDRLGRPDLGDRLHFAARLRYRVAGPWSSLCTVGLLFARRMESWS
jgi:hypothetical protein